MAVTAPTQEFKNPTSCTNAFGRIFSAVGSTVYFSQVLVTAKDAGICYQLNDPISEDIPDVLDTDGGYIFLDDAINIQNITPFRSGVVVFAQNGVWYIYNPDGGFTATSFNVTKVTERGLNSKRSVVEAEGSLFYLSANGIIRIYADEFDNLRGEDITELSVRGYMVDNFVGKGTQGEYDEANKQVVWWNPDADSRGIVLDLTVNAFYPQKNASSSNRIAKPIRINNSFFYPYWGDTTYSLAQTTNESFQDFGVDVNAYLISGWETLGKFANKKSVTQAKVFFNKTETQITGYNEGYEFDSPSGCLFQSRWDFDNSNAYSKWVGVVDAVGTGRPIQLYNPLQRGFIPDSYPYDFDTGESVISKKFNIRGNGDAVQFYFKAEPEKDMQLLGYSVTFTMRGRI